MLFLKLKKIKKYVILFPILSITPINSEKVTIHNEKDLINTISKVNNNELVINIPKETIEISSNIEISNNYKSLSIVGISKELSKLKLNEETSSLIFNSSVSQIKIENLSIEGHLNFKKYSKIESNEKIDNCIDLSGKVIINESFFYGSHSCKDSIINYNGSNDGSFNLTKSYFDGVYLNNCLSITNSNSAFIESSNFEKGASYDDDNGGGAIRLIDSNLNIRDCQFKDNFSSKNGGVFYVNEGKSFNAINIKAYNSSALEKGGLIYITSMNDIYASLTNIEYYEAGNINGNLKNIEFEGLIAR
ncbi:hypothetical protein PIROE2DRAFT_7569 [Piromyces sp. E2]|nr:hypothetical protein PIROE2DRAFT_7569 [Piromyces sp. E2]|eukprot:OUM65453.1 hypothetical protein PIROE2DRAFT_7569 [Piromyces sp. E2]